MMMTLARLEERGGLSPLALHFARFVTRGCGVDTDSPLGLAAALVSERALHGDVCVALERFAGRPLFSAEGSGILAPQLEAWIEALEKAPWVGGKEALKPLMLERGRLYLGRYWKAERQVADAITARLDHSPVVEIARVEKGLRKLFEGEPAETFWQQVAVAMALLNRFCVVAGGPGTGKTTTVVRILALLLEQEPCLRIGLAAPTGKAAARLGESIRGSRQMPADVALPHTASTIHRLLGAARGGFRHNRDNPLPLDCLVVDEASMVDLELMAALAEALPDACRLILLGDRDQLASVEAGSVLGDITGRGRPIRYSTQLVERLAKLGIELPDSVRSEEAGSLEGGIALLRHSWRFAGGGGIGCLAEAVNRGDGEQAVALLREAVAGGAPSSAVPILSAKSRKEIAWLPQSARRPGREVVEWAVSRYTDFLQEEEIKQALSRFNRIRVLCALHEGPWGEQEMATWIEAGLMAEGLIPGGSDYHGLPILIVRNDYETRLFNGETGLLWRDGDGRLQGWFEKSDGELRKVPLHQLPPWEPAWALTVHRAQGSEFDQVLLVLPPGGSPVVGRELVYTGITRARNCCVLACEEEALAQAVALPIERDSGLAERLGWLIDD